METPGERGLVRMRGDSPEVGGEMLTGVVQARDLFWRNVMREILTSLSVASLSRRTAQEQAGADGQGDAEPEGEDLFDGRLAILTHAGERIAIAEVYPLFACGIQTSRSSRALSMAVECSVFQIRTPSGEVFTLPLQEMRGFHAMTPELMQALSDEARKRAEETSMEKTAEPFGFAAFTSLAKQQESEPSASVPSKRGTKRRRHGGKSE
jgi:hypothetical protein